MLTSIAIVFLFGIIMGGIFKRLRLPPLIGMIITGIVLGPSALNLLDVSILNISADLRQMALVIILTRAGLSLNIGDLKKVGRPAVLMCFVPACFEIIGCVLAAPKLLGISYLEAAIMGSVTAAVSPAVIVPRMIKLIDEGYGVNKGIPQMILAGASVDDVFVIVMFTVFTSVILGGAVLISDFVQIPVSIILGIALGIACGVILIRIFKLIHMRDTVKILLILSVSFLFLQAESSLKGIVPISGLIAIMSMGAVIKKCNIELADRLSQKYNKLWVMAEILLFVLVGVTVDLQYAVKAGAAFALVIATALIFRMIGVFVCTLKTNLNNKERLFCMMAYVPKATVQAAIGSIPLAMGLNCGQAVLTVAVLSILFTAPIGAIAVDTTYKKLLDKFVE